MEEKIFYITKEKLAQIKKELKELIALERQKTVGVEAPKVLESEELNQDFVSYHEDMDALRLKIEELQHVIDHHQIIKNPPKEKTSLVDVGAKVKIDTDGKHHEFMIVGTLEANPENGKISNESPLGKALMGHKVGDEILVDFPEKVKHKIKGIKYEIS